MHSRSNAQYRAEDKTMTPITTGILSGILLAGAVLICKPAASEELNPNIKAGIAAVAYDALCHEPMGVVVDAYVKKAAKATGASEPMIVKIIIRGGFKRASDIILTNRYHQFCNGGQTIVSTRSS